MDIGLIEISARNAVRELFSFKSPSAGELFVLGCSTSAVLGKPLGETSDSAIGAAIVASVFDECNRFGIVLAVQGCEHINRALTVPSDIIERNGLVQVRIRPVSDAGGAASQEYFELLGAKASVVEDLGRGADYGLDIGGVLIGMHLRRDRVAVPVPITADIGAASVNGAYCRLKWVGGPRTCS